VAPAQRFFVTSAVHSRAKRFVLPSHLIARSASSAALSLFSRQYSTRYPMASSDRQAQVHASSLFSYAVLAAPTAVCCPLSSSEPFSQLLCVCVCIWGGKEGGLLWLLHVVQTLCTALNTDVRSRSLTAPWQLEEIEVLQSIYGAHWATVNQETGEYIIAINALWTLVVLLPDTYPSTDAPVFELRGPPAFEQEAKDQIALRLQEMFQEQVG
jgi:hypothetical protein